MKKGFDHHILLLQGGGALGAYQAGAYEGLVEAGNAPDWVVGISIGAFNAALIAGNPPGRRVERLREFWDRVSSHAPLILPPWFAPVRPLLNQLSSTCSLLFGVPSFFTPRVPAPSFYMPYEGPDSLSYYDTEPLKATLEELVDFDLINRRRVRLSLGAVSLTTGQSTYFDNQQTRIGPDHVRASGALPPGCRPSKSMAITTGTAVWSPTRRSCTCWRTFPACGRWWSKSISFGAMRSCPATWMR